MLANKDAKFPDAAAGRAAAAPPGSGAAPNESPVGEKPPKWTADTLVFDTVYNPMRTRFLQQAEAVGAKTIGGVEMFIRQAAAQFEAWTGRQAPIDVMRTVVEKRLSS